MSSSTQDTSQQLSPMMAKPSESNRGKKYDPKKPHITDEPITSANWYKHINWLNVTLIIGIPMYGMIQAYWTPLQLKTAIFAVVYYFATGLGITAGMLKLICTTYNEKVWPQLILLQVIIDYGRTLRIPQQHP
jgi:stearoyl-CoA desaturase (delta-9 desaturase)